MLGEEQDATPCPWEVESLVMHSDILGPACNYIFHS